MNKIVATHFVTNFASEKVLIKIGMKKEGIFDEHYFKNNKYINVNQYQILKKEYKK